MAAKTKATRTVANQVIRGRAEVDGTPLVTFGGVVYKYTGTHYAPDLFIRRDLIRQANAGGLHNQQSWNAVEEIIKEETLRIEQPDSGYVPFLDGRVLTDGSKELLEHDPSYFHTYVLPYRYGEWGEAPRFEQFLREVTGGDVDNMLLLQEIAGYILMPTLYLDKAFVLYGPEGTGKSVMIEVLEAMVGEANVSHVPLERFGDRFALSNTENKLLNTATEIGKTTKSIDGVFKSYVSGEAIVLERKYKDAHSFRPTAKLVFGSNIIPSFHNLSGLGRRLVFVKFDQVPKERDPNLIDKLKQELPGIFDWAYDGMLRLEERQEFTTPQTSLDIQKEFKSSTSSVFEFIEEYPPVNTAEGIVDLKELYETYVNATKENGRSAVAYQRFYAELRELVPFELRSARVKKRGRLRDKTVLGGVTFPSLDHVGVTGEDQLVALEYFN